MTTQALTIDPQHTALLVLDYQPWDQRTRQRPGGRWW